MNKMLILVLSLMAISAATLKIISDPNVIELSKDTIDNFINENDFGMINFYADWCEHCKTLNPEITKFGQLLKESNIT